MNENLDLTVLVPEFPSVPNIEISRDGLVSRLIDSFGPGCQKQVVISDDYYGKTNLLSQFCRRHPGNSIGYFITSNPITHYYRNFLFVICNQITRILDEKSIPVDIGEAELKTIYTGLSLKLSEEAKICDRHFYIVIDGIEAVLESDAGNAIVNNPPILSTLSPYLLFSATPEVFERLPEQYKKGAVKQQFEAALQFNYDDTEKFLSDFDLSNQEIRHINEKSKGVAGYLDVLRDSIKTSGKDWINDDRLPDNLRKLVSNQIDHVFSNATVPVKEIIEVVAVGPKPIKISSLQKYFDNNIQLDKLNKTGLLIYDTERNTLVLKQNIAKQIIQEKMGARKAEIQQKLLDIEKIDSKNDPELLTLLLEELNDYRGLSELLNINNIRESLDTGDAATVLERVRKISRMAFISNEIKDISKWSWVLAAFKEFLLHASSIYEIDALIAIGETQKALQMAYNFPESINRIRMLARVYTSMKDKQEHVPKNAIDELIVMLDEEGIEKLEKEVVQDIAIDILPLLPSKAVSLLERVIGEPKEQNLIDVAISAVRNSVNSVNSKDYSLNNLERNQVGGRSSKKFEILKPDWLKGLNLAHLLKEIEDLKNTKAKEFIIRQWCSQNTDHQELSYGIELWLDTVIQDEKFVISLRSLRQLSELLKKLDVVDCRRLIERFQISAIDSLHTPWEEWVGFHLNIAEVLYEYDSSSAIEKIDSVYETINVYIDDFDIKVFCYARLWGTYRRLNLIEEENVRDNFERVLSHLLKDSALQDEILNKTLMILAGIDIDYALNVANRLNTVESRKQANKIVLINGFIKHPSKDFSIQLKQIIKELDTFEQDVFIYDLVEEISSRRISVDHECQKLLFYESRQIRNQIEKSITLVRLASFWTNENLIKRPKILNEAHISWQNEDDLKKKISIGFQLVEQISSIDKDFAKTFCEDVQSTLIFPGAELAIGGLGVMYIDSIDLAIRSLCVECINDRNSLEKIFDQIDKLPSNYLRNQLYTQLSAKIYSMGIYPVAEEIIEEKVLNPLSKIDNQNIREKIIRFSLPVIYWYNQDIARKLSKEVSRSVVNLCWLRVILWSLSKGQIGDITNFESFKVAANHTTIRDKAFGALEQINEDVYLSLGVNIITRSIEYSVRNRKLDTKNAFDILLDIEEYVTNNLPDLNNIKHIGYKLISIARINGARSCIYREINQKGPFNKIDIRKKWGELEKSARSEIDNLADRVFVITTLAEEMRCWDSNKAEVLLDSISEDINKIPSLLDRSDRIEKIAKAWGMWGKKTQANYFFSKSIELLKELSPWSKDKKLEHIVQAAYQISPDFADELVERFDSRLPEKVFEPYEIKLKSLKYSHDLEGLIKDSECNQSQMQGMIIKSSVKKLLNDLLNQDGQLYAEKKVGEMIYRSSCFEPNVVRDVLKWALECENRHNRLSKTGIFEDFISASAFIHELANWILPREQMGISQEICHLLPGLSSKVVVFQPGQRKRAEDWVKNWIKQNTEEYIKICDPYFSPKELTFLSDIQRDIKILIITTTEKFEKTESAETMQQELIETWRSVGKGKIPSMTLLIVPAKLKNTFHDRAIITGKGGLDIGPSLNGLGNELQRITELGYNESKELEVKYIDDMLNQGKWFVNHSVHPQYLII